MLYFDRYAGRYCFPDEAKDSHDNRCLKFNSNAPIYYATQSCNANKFKIAYWFWYGLQKCCICKSQLIIFLYMSISLYLFLSRCSTVRLLDTSPPFLARNNKIWCKISPLLHLLPFPEHAEALKVLQTSLSRRMLENHPLTPQNSLKLINS